MRVWEHRFKSRQSVPVFEKINSSIEIDKYLYNEEIEASIAYACALNKAGVLTNHELDEIVSGLNIVHKKIEAGEDLSIYEDIHSAVEFMLINEIGKTGGKLHTGRSRNEQVVTDERLYLKGKIGEILNLIYSIQKRIISLAEDNMGMIIPGYTHLRRAQFVLFSHYIMSLFWQINRGSQRLAEVANRVDVCPLGSGALAGTTIPLDRENIRERLGFARISENSIDIVSDRSFILEALFVLSLIMLDISRFAEDMIIYSTEEFNLITLDDELVTSSSLMPQKKNPDIFELLRQSPAKIWGHINNLFITIKGLPSTYNKDLQEDKLPLIHGINVGIDTLKVFYEALGRFKFLTKNTYSSPDNYMFATDMAERLVNQGLPFREAHGVISKLMADSEQNNKSLKDYSDAELAEIHPQLNRNLFNGLDRVTSVNMKKTVGSTNSSKVQRQIEKAKKILMEMENIYTG